MFDWWRGRVGVGWNVKFTKWTPQFGTAPLVFGWWRGGVVWNVKFTKWHIAYTPKGHWRVLTFKWHLCYDNKIIYKWTVGSGCLSNEWMFFLTCVFHDALTAHTVYVLVWHNLIVYHTELYFIRVNAATVLPQTCRVNNHGCWVGPTVHFFGVWQVYRPVSISSVPESIVVNWLTGNNGYRLYCPWQRT